MLQRSVPPFQNSDDRIHGRSLLFLGVALNHVGQQQEALHYLDHARAMLHAVGNIPDLASTCQVIARVHYHHRKLPEALDAMEEAWKHTELGNNAYSQAVISLEFSYILVSANRDAEARKYIEIALMKASHIGNQLQVARALEAMGYWYLCRSDYRNAFGAYEAAAEKYLNTLDAWVEKRCKDNMASIERKQGNHNG